jgi:transposase
VNTAVAGSRELPSREELVRLPVEVLADLLLTALTQVGQLTQQSEQLGRQVEQLTRRVEELERRATRTSRTSGKPPSSDPIHTKPGSGSDAQRDAGSSARQASGRRPGKQRGAQGTTMRLVDDPDERVSCPPLVCAGCAGELSQAPVTATERRQVTEISPPPPPRIIEYVAQAKVCPGCGTTTLGELPVGVDGRAQYGVEVHARAAELVLAHHVPVARAARLLAQLSGVEASVGWVGGLRAKASRLLDAAGFAEHLCDLLRQAPALHVDETPARAAGGLTYVHVACTRYLTLLHTGSRSAQTIDGGGVLPGYQGVIVRDGYAGYQHLTDAAHAWCAAHLLRDLKDLYEYEPARQAWAAAMAELLIDARDAAGLARQAGSSTLDEAVLTALVDRYRLLAADGLTSNTHRRTATAADARRIARRFTTYEDMILRFATRPDLDIFTNNEAERTLRPVKVQMRASGGCWRKLICLAQFATVQSYLSTVTKWGITTLDALRLLFTGRPWLPPGIAPT